MAKRPYTGWDRDVTGKRAGTERLIKLIEDWSGKALWNNGSWGVRSKRGKAGNPSVHGTARAFDISWRKMARKGSGDYADAVRVADLLVANADALGIEAVFDYYPAPFGRGWKCDRDSWQVYDSQAFHGAPGGDWLHVEVSNAVADDPAHFDRVWAEIAGGVKPAVQPVVSSDRPYPGVALRIGSKGDDVKWVQAIVGTTVDGDFGRQTDRAVRRFQSRNRAHPVDGIVGKITWAALNKMK